MNPTFPVNEAPDRFAACSRKLRSRLELTPAELARAVASSEQTVNDWESTAKANPDAAADVEELAHFCDEFRHYFVNPNELPGWMRAANPAFGGLTPLQVVARGEIERLWRMLHMLSGGSIG